MSLPLKMFSEKMPFTIGRLSWKTVLSANTSVQKFALRISFTTNCNIVFLRISSVACTDL